MERVESLDRTPSREASALMRGVIRELKHLSAGTDVASTHVVASHNCVGYGHINSAVGDVFFDASAITNPPFDKLTQNMTVEFALDQAPYLRTSRIAVITATSAAARTID